MELTIEQALQQGVAAHREGKLQDAERLYRAILHSQPLHPDANHNLGVLAVSLKKAESALPLFKTALETNPKIDQFWLSYIDALIKEKQFYNAKQVLNQSKKFGLIGDKVDELESQLKKLTQPALPKAPEKKKSLTLKEKRRGSSEQRKKAKNQNLKAKNPSQQQLNSLTEHYQNRRFSEAEELSVEITQAFPKHQFAWTVLGAVLSLTGRKSEAVNANRTAVKLSPQDAAAHSNLGIALRELGRLDEAIASYTQAIALKPNFAEAYYSLGNTLNELGRLDEAEAKYNRAIESKPAFAEAHSNLGNTLKDLGRLDEAKASYNQAIALKPDYVEAYSNLGALLQKLGRLGEAEASCRQAISLKPDYAEAHNNLGVTLKKLGRWDEAEASCTQAIALKPDYAEAQLNLCELLEKMNRADELSSFIRSVSRNILEKSADFLYFEALTEFRQENYEKAAELVEEINIPELLDERQPFAMKLVGDIYHHKGNYSAAFEAYQSRNKYVKASLEYKKQDREKYFSQQRGKVAQIEQLQEKSTYRSVINPSWIQPTFLIGFPRSGTTLLDTILRTHSNINVLEELPMFSKMKKGMGDIPTFSKIEAMDNAEAESASGFYFEELKKHIEFGNEQILVDKLPLNILELPLINQVFPNAKYIIALRHPLDCVLSCWMQNFNLTPAMANMIDLERIVDFYDVAMSILKLCEKRYSLDIHKIRYEDVVVNFEGNVSSLLTFLDLKWEEKLRSYHETALARGKINTPSYSQVIQPLYKTASYRWKNYEEYLEPYKLRLAPWIKEYGY